MKKRDLLGIFLAIVTGLALLCAILLRTFLPRIILPRLDAITLIALSLIALILDHYVTPGKREKFWKVPLYGALIFGLFPLAACLVVPLSALTLAVLGTVIFTVVTFLFDSMTERLSSGPVAKLAPAISAFGLFLAAQCLMGIV